MIEVRNISKEIFSADGIKRYELKNVSMNIESEQITSIIGASGSGKSTLLQLIASLCKPTGGEIVNNMKGKVIYVPSVYQSFPWLSVSENISFPKKRISDSELQNLVHKVDLDGYANFYPNNNSLGFRFRIALARVLSQNPVLIVLDDVFRLMDETTKEEIFELIHRINQKEHLAFLLATSNISEALHISDKVYLLKQESCELVFNYSLDLIHGKTSKEEKLVVLKKQIEIFLGKTAATEIFKVTL